MESPGSWILKVTALSLGIAGWATYLLFWLGIRLFGKVTLTFGHWGPGWLEWFENWIEPLVLISWLALLGWALWHEFRKPAGQAQSNLNTEGSLSRHSQTLPTASYDNAISAYSGRYIERRKPWRITANKQAL